MSRKAIISYDKGAVSTQVPFDPTSGRKFKSDMFFREQSQFLSHALSCDYIEITAKGDSRSTIVGATNWIQNIAQGAKWSGESFEFFYGQWTDHGDVIMTPKSCHLTLADCGIRVVDPAKAPKYFNRVKAPHKAAVFGGKPIIQQVSDGWLVYFTLEDGYKGCARIIDMKYLDDRRTAIADGQLRIKTDFYRHIGKLCGIRSRNWNTYSGKVTVFNPLGVQKGYGHSQPDLKYDIVAYGTKEAVLYDNFFFGIMSDVNPGRNCRTDIQSIINFDLHAFCPEAFDRLCRKIIEIKNDEDKLLAFFLRMQENVESAQEWMLPRAISLGMSPKVEPSLSRRVSNHFMYDINKPEFGRIPWDDSAMRASIVPDPFMFDQYGDITPSDTHIPHDCMVLMDVRPGLTAEYRQPNGNPLEHSRSRNMHLPEYEQYRGLQRCFYGADLLEKNAPKNGADNDDDQVVVFDPKIVEHFYNLDYKLGKRLGPMSEPAKTVAKLTDYYKLLSEGKQQVGEVGSFTLSDFVKSMTAATASGLKLGQIVLTIMADVSSSGDNKVSMLNDLRERIDAEQDPEAKAALIPFYERLEKRAEYQSRDVATNLEHVIDYAVARKGDPRMLKPLYDQVLKIREEMEVYPYFFALPGTGVLGTGRISPTKVLGVDYVLAKSLFDRELDKILDQRVNFVNALKLEEWDCISDVPVDVDMHYSMEGDFHQIVMEIRKDWNISMSQLVGLPPEASRQVYKDLLRGKFHVCDNMCPRNCPLMGRLIEPGLVQRMNEFTREEQEFITVELKRLCHANKVPKIDETTGLYRSVPDSAFGNDYVFGIYLDILEQLNLTGKYVKVDFEPGCWNYQDEKMIVNIDNGLVYDPDNNDLIGNMGDDSISGEYTMKYGYVEVASPDPSIRQVRFGADDIELM